MGHFLAVTAFRTESVHSVTEAISNYVKHREVSIEILPSTAEVDESTDVTVYLPQDGWCVVLWPMYFNIHDFAFVREITSTELATGSSTVTNLSQSFSTVSTIHVYDGDYWEHLFCANGEELHLFCSNPDYWGDEGEDGGQQVYKIDPEKMCACLKVDPAKIRPYLVNAGELDGKEKAFEQDEFELGDIWVITDFWRQLGITYPDPPDSNVAAVLRLASDFSSRLPN